MFVRFSACVAQRRNGNNKKKKSLWEQRNKELEYVTLFTCLAHEFIFLPHTYHTCLNKGPRKHANHIDEWANWISLSATVPRHFHTATYTHSLTALCLH